IGIAAAAVLSVAGAAWYLRADLFFSSTPAANQPVRAAASSLPPSQPAAESNPPAPTPAENLNSAPPPVAASPAPSRPLPVKSAEPPASTTLTTAAARELKTLTSETKKPERPDAATPVPTPQREERSGLGDVRLATPKLRRRTGSQPTADAL